MKETQLQQLREFLKKEMARKGLVNEAFITLCSIPPHSYISPVMHLPAFR